MIRVFERSVRRAKLPLTYSQGFNPHPKIAFGPALALGTASDKEYVDISFDGDVNVNQAVEALDQHLPPGVNILRAKMVPQGAEALNALINRASYSVSCPLSQEVSEQELKKFCQELLQKDTIIIKKQTKKGVQEKDIRKGIFALDCALEEGQARLYCELMLGPKGSVRPEEVIRELVALGMPLTADYKSIRRTGLYCCRDNSCADPLQVL